MSSITLRSIILAIFLAILLAASSTYLALKIGILPSASIPAAIIAMGVLKLFRKSTIHETNLVQTAASAGEAIAGGIVYTIPAMIIIHYWQRFNYWENVAIALVGGIMGVLFSIPLRRVLMRQKLPFPEGRAIAHILEMNHSQSDKSLRHLLMGGAIGAVIEFAQTGLHLIASQAEIWGRVQQRVVGFGVGFSATLIGAGYLMGLRLGLSILLGAILNWLIAIPLMSGHASLAASASDIAHSLWGEQLRFVGIGAMLMAGIITLLTLLKPFFLSLKTSLQIFNKPARVISSEQDLPLRLVIIGIGIGMVSLYFLFQHSFHLQQLPFTAGWRLALLFGSLAYILIVGFCFAAICGYFSGLVGVTASPGSAIVIAGILFAAALLRILLQALNIPMTNSLIQHGCAIIIMIGAIVTGMACIANDNIQDLKVGHIIGTTPWQQQVMLIIGAIAASLVIPLVMQLLFSVYGIADVLPHAGMRASQALSAPPAAMMATLTKAVFNHQVPWTMLRVGAALVIALVAVNYLLAKRGWEISILAVGIGMYLPLSSSMPLFFGGLFAALHERSLKNNSELGKQPGVLRACGMVSGAALMDVALAIPMVIAGNPNVLQIVKDGHGLALTTLLGVISLAGMAYWLIKARRA